MPRRRCVPVLLALWAGLAAAPPAGAADWSTFGYTPERRGENPHERALGVANAPRLREVWSAPLGGVGNTQPLVVSGVRLRGGARRDLVVAGSEGGLLSAFDAAGGRLVWRRHLGTQRTSCGDVPGGRYGVTATPVVDRRRGTLFAAGDDGRVHALDLASGAERRGWPLRVGPPPRREHVWGALALRAGRLYVATASHCSEVFYRGRLVLFDVVRARRLATWHAMGRGGRGGGIYGWGGAALDVRGDVYAATAVAQTPPYDAPYGQHVVRLSPGLRLRSAHHPPVPVDADSDIGAAPLLFRAGGCSPQLVVLHKSGALLLYDRDRIARGPRQVLQIGRSGGRGAFGTYAYSSSRRLLYVANNTDSDDGAFTHGLVVLRVTAGCMLAPAWQHPVGPDPAINSPPIVANGVVYLGTGFGAELWAFHAATGRPLWRALLPGGVYAAPSVVNGRLYAVAWDGRLRAFAPAP
jgi:outer membrane protein assembly factor BamB